VLEAIGTTLTAADTTLAGTGLDTRLAGPALDSRRAEYAVTTATAGAKALTALAMNAQTLVVPSTGGWPRTELRGDQAAGRPVKSAAPRAAAGRPA